MKKTPPRPRIKQIDKEVVDSAWRPYQKRFINDPCKKRLWVKSAQIGGSTTLASWALSRCVNRRKHNVVILSASERQAKEVALKSDEFIQALGGVEHQLETEQKFFGDVETSVHTIHCPNDSRIIALAAKPETARGYTGDIVLDEFAHAQNDEKIFTAAYRQVTLADLKDLQMLVISTPNGQQGRFWKMAKELGLDRGMAPPIQPTQRGAWSGHWTDIYLAVAEGLPVDPENIRSGCDEMTWQQEYLCQFLAENALWISPDLLAACIDAYASVGPPPLHLSNLFCGWDIARNGHHSTLYFNDLRGDVSNCVGVVNVRGMSTPEQLEQARAWIPQCARITVDKTGMGITIAEVLERDYPGKAEGLVFTAPIKEQMAVHVRMRMEQRKLRLPNDDVVRRHFMALRRSTNKVGQARFDAESDEKFGHADTFWACALAEMAAERGISEAVRRGSSDIQFPRQTVSPLSNFQNRPL